jgi:acetyltransferase
MPELESIEGDIFDVDKQKIRKIVDKAGNGYMNPDLVQELIDSVSIPRVSEQVVDTEKDLLYFAHELSYPLVMKVVGPVHKSDVGGVSLNIDNDELLVSEFRRMMKIYEANGVLLQPMLSGLELFIGAKHEKLFGHIILCGLGGIYIELLKDVAAGLAPLTKIETIKMIQSLKAYNIFKGARGQKPINENDFADIMLKLSTLLHFAPEIEELDFNPLLANGEKIIVVDARIKINKAIK